MFFKIGVVKNFNFVLESFFNKVADLQANFIKKKLQHRCFPVNIAKFLRTAFYRTPTVAASELTKHLFQAGFQRNHMPCLETA